MLSGHFTNGWVNSGFAGCDPQTKSDQNPGYDHRLDVPRRKAVN